jgi:aryl-alcohol dehydrogenase-like predicted oxidoreductase
MTFGEQNSEQEGHTQLDYATEQGVNFLVETRWGVMTFLRASEQYRLPRIASVQNAYNLVNRSYEIGLSEITYREQVSLLAYSPLGQGYLSEI